MKVEKYSKDGKVIGEIELADAVFSVEVNDTLIYELIKAANANLRQGTHKTKGRTEVSGGGAKPWKQKGTGRARQGTIRAPQWRGGGIVFGPVPRSYRIDLPKKTKQAAYRSLLSLKAKNGEIKVVEDFNAAGKTREMAQLGKALNVSKGVLVSDADDILIKRAFKNIPWFSYNNVERISSRDIFYSKQVVITESALKRLNDKYSKGE
jgi:large subunit ribosomal protein L4